MSPDVEGFTVGFVDDARGWIPIAIGMTWSGAVRRAYLYSLVRRGRILTSRTGDHFEVLEPDRVWLGEFRRWRPFEPLSIQRDVPDRPGVYVLRALTPIFVGQTENLRDRLLYHLAHPEPCEDHQGALEFCFHESASADERGAVVTELVDWWTPPCNQLT